VNFEFTYYSKQTKDALESYSYAPSAAASSSITRNLGGVKNAGVEGVGDRPRWSIAPSFAVGRHHRWFPQQEQGDVSRFRRRRQAARSDASHVDEPDDRGYPLGSTWYRPFTWNDDNNDGIIRRTSASVGPLEGRLRGYIGPSFPTDLVNVTTGVDLSARKLRVNVTANYSGLQQVQQHPVVPLRANADLLLDAEPGRAAVGSGAAVAATRCYRRRFARAAGIPRT
jgi:hypothetical protein